MNEIKFNIGDVVFLKTDSQQEIRVVTGILLRPSGNLYYLSKSTEETTHYEIEISKEVNELIKLI